MSRGIWPQHHKSWQALILHSIFLLAFNRLTCVNEFGMAPYSTNVCFVLHLLCFRPHPALLSTNQDDFQVHPSCQSWENPDHPNSMRIKELTSITTGSPVAITEWDRFLLHSHDRWAITARGTIEKVAGSHNQHSSSLSGNRLVTGNYDFRIPARCWRRYQSRLF